MINPHTLFISDLHLSEDHPETTELFFQFLKSKANTAEALYILGDFFEVWVGDDDHSAFNETVKKQLREFTQTGIPTYFMHGNRDFLIRKRFAKETGITLLKEPSTIDLYGEPVLLLHGDSLCTLDERHQKSRKIMHNRFYQSAVLWLLPLKARRHYGYRFRTNSAGRKKALSNDIMDVTPEEVIRVMSDAKVNTLIHGHTHRPAIHPLTINNNDAKRIVLGDWHDKGTYLQANADQSFQLVEFP